MFEIKIKGVALFPWKTSCSLFTYFLWQIKNIGIDGQFLKTKYMDNFDSKLDIINL